MRSILSSHSLSREGDDLRDVGARCVTGLNYISSGDRCMSMVMVKALAS